MFNIQKSHQIHINPREIPLDDKLTYELFQRGDSIGTFQFESDGMRQHMQNLKPDRFEDLIAMNARSSRPNAVYTKLYCKKA